MPEARRKSSRGVSIRSRESGAWIDITAAVAKSRGKLLWKSRAKFGRKAQAFDGNILSDACLAPDIIDIINFMRNGHFI
jgi:hypothetical protein